MSSSVESPVVLGETLGAAVVDDAEAAVDGLDPLAGERWEPVAIRAAVLATEIERLGTGARVDDGFRRALVVHPRAVGTSGRGLAPGIEVSINVLAPGEVATPSRVNSAAICFVLDGAVEASIDGRAFTAARWDVWTEPSMARARYRAGGSVPLVVLRFSNAALLRMLGVHVVQPQDAAEPNGHRPRPDGPDGSVVVDDRIASFGPDGPYRLTYERLIDPPWVEARSWHWSWGAVKAELDAMAALGPSYDGRRVCLLHDPATGRTNGATFNLNASMCMRPAGIVDPPHRHTAAAVNLFFEGEGWSTIGGRRVTWASGDLLLAAPGWTVHHHAAGPAPVYQLAVQDNPLHLAMGSLLWQEQLDVVPKLLGHEPGYVTNRDEILPVTAIPLHPEDRATPAVEHVWPEGGAAHVPYWVYRDETLYEAEIERIFEGPSWCYVGLAAEVPDEGSYLTTWIGRRSVILTRAKDSSLHVLENRCAHRGVQVCPEPFGTASMLQCPYHQWTYDLTGRLLGVPFRKGVAGKGGMPDTFDPADNGLRALAVHERHGVVFASFDDRVEPFEDYVGSSMLGWFDRVFDGRPLQVLGEVHQRIPANWKLMLENIKDPYHASVLHVFLVTFGLFRADNPSRTQMDPTGRHSVLVAARRSPTEEGAAMQSFHHDLLTLEDERQLDIVREFEGDATVVMQTLWPNCIVQQQSNTLAVRQIVPRGVDQFDLHWTFFGYADDSPEMTERRLLQANLMGPSGYVSLDDGEVLALAQAGAEAAPESGGLLAMGGDEIGDVEHVVTETAIRAFYRHYRNVMGL